MAPSKKTAKAAPKKSVKKAAPKKAAKKVAPKRAPAKKSAFSSPAAAGTRKKVPKGKWAENIKKEFDEILPLLKKSETGIYLVIAPSLDGEKTQGALVINNTTPVEAAHALLKCLPKEITEHMFEHLLMDLATSK